MNSETHAQAILRLAAALIRSRGIAFHHARALAELALAPSIRRA